MSVASSCIEESELESINVMRHAWKIQKYVYALKMSLTTGPPGAAAADEEADVAATEEAEVEEEAAVTVEVRAARPDTPVVLRSGRVMFPLMRRDACVFVIIIIIIIILFLLNANKRDVN